MRFISIISVAAAFVAPALADFHIQNCIHTYGAGSQSDTEYPTIATPSNKWNCSGFRNSSPIADGTDGEDKQKSVFAVENLCGYKKLNFYPSGSELKVYVDSGNGQVVATCYKGDHKQKDCAAAFDLLSCYNDWVCYSSICS